MECVSERRFARKWLLPYGSSMIEVIASLALQRRLLMSVSACLLGVAVGGRPSHAFAADKPDLTAIHGRIQVVTSFPDYRVKVVDSFADLHVQVVESFPDKPGRWQMVESFPDYKVEFVDSFPDFTIRYVDSFPGPQ